MTDKAETPEFDYDRVQYPSNVLGHLSPSRLRAAALLHGRRAPDPAHASVLEIGCGDGINLIAFAAATPGARAVGFDFSAPAIARGRALVAAAQLRNVDLHFGDALSYPHEGEKFDYIICHGVLTWVPPPVRDAVIGLIGARLAPGGLAYISFDCLPGAWAKSAIVSFLREQVGSISDPAEAMIKGAELIGMLARAQRKTSRLQVQLDLLIKDMPKFEPGYFFHDWLAEHYAPVDLRDFIAAAASRNLMLAGSVAGYDLVVDDLDPDARSLIDRLGDNWGERLAAFEMLHGGHIFHRDLLVRADAPPPAAPDGITGVSFAFTGSREEVAAEDGKAITYTAGEDIMVTTATPSTIAVLDCLWAAESAEVGYADILRETGVDEAKLRQILLFLNALSMVEANATPQPFVVHPGERPRAGHMVRVMLELGDRAASLRCSGIEADQPETRYCLVLCDGTRTREEIAATMTAAFGKEITVEMVDAAIASFARRRVFEA